MKALLHYFTREQLNWLVIYRHQESPLLLVDLLKLKLARLQLYHAIELQIRKDLAALARWWHQLARRNRSGTFFI